MYLDRLSSKKIHLSITCLLNDLQCSLQTITKRVPLRSFVCQAGSLDIMMEYALALQLREKNARKAHGASACLLQLVFISSGGLQTLIIHRPDDWQFRVKPAILMDYDSPSCCLKRLINKSSRALPTRIMCDWTSSESLLQANGQRRENYRRKMVYVSK